MVMMMLILVYLLMLLRYATVTGVPKVFQQYPLAMPALRRRVAFWHSINAKRQQLLLLIGSVRSEPAAS